MSRRPAPAPRGGGEGRGSPDANIRFYVGLHQPSDAKYFDQCMVSVTRLRERKGDFQVGEWMMDSGAFTELKLFGRYRHSVEEYAAQIRRWRLCGQLVAAVAQDYMCEPFMLARTGLTVADHQRLTIARYDTLHSLAADTGVYILPVLQGYAPGEYVDHIRQYGRRLTKGMWVGVGSVCKRNGDPSAIRDVLYAIHRARPDLRLHGFGIKQTALSSAIVRQLLWSADSLAWSYAARKQGRNANDYREARQYVRRVDGRDLSDLPMFQQTEAPVSTLAEDVRRQSELLERVHLEIHLAHNRVFGESAPSWEAALARLEHAAGLRATSRRLPPEAPPAEEAPATDFGERWETL